MAYNPIFGSGTTAPPKPDDPNTSALDKIANLPSTLPATSAGLTGLTPGTVTGNPAPSTLPATPALPGAKPPGSLTSIGSQAPAAPAPTTATKATSAGLTGLTPGTVTGNPAPAVPPPGTLPTGMTPTGGFPSSGTRTTTSGTPLTAGGTNAPGAATPTIEPMPIVRPDTPPDYWYDNPGKYDLASGNSAKYMLGNDPYFASNLSYAMQGNAQVGSAAVQQAANTAQAVGNQAQVDSRTLGGSAAQYGRDMAGGVQRLGSNLTAQGQEMGNLAEGVTGRAAPALDTAAQNADLAAAYGTATRLGSAGAGLLAAGQAAQGRTAPALDTAAQNATLGLSQGATTQLGQTGDVMGQLGLQAGSRATPAANYGQAQSTLGASLGTAGRLGTTADQVNAAAIAAGQRGGIGADYGQSRSALDQLAALESGPGQSGAEALMRQGASQAAQQALMLAHSGRGFGANAQGTSEALRSNAAAMQGVENQAAQLRAQEYAQRQQRAASNLTTQAGMLSGQSQADQAAALQARAQNDQAQAALYGLGTQATTSQAGLQQAAAQQFGTQAAADQAAALQSRQLNDQSQNALLAGQAAAQQNQAALFQGQAQQLGQQAGLNQAAALQASQQNDAATAALSGLGAQALSNTAGLQQASAAQLGQQAQLNQAAQLQSTAQNDAAAEAYRQLQLQAGQSGVNAQVAAGQLGLAGMETGAGILNQGTTAALQGNELAMQGALQGTQLNQNALTATGQIAQVATELGQRQIEDSLQQYGIHEGVATNTRAQNMAMIGAGISALGTFGAALSDKRAKKSIRSASKEELMLSPGDSLLQPKVPRSALDQLSELSGEELDAHRNGLTGEEIDAQPDPYELNYRPPPYWNGGPINAPKGGKTGLDVQGPGGPAYDKAMGEAAAAKGAADHERTARLAGAFSGFGADVARGLQTTAPLPTVRRRPLSTIGGPSILSDEKEKTDLREAKGYSYEYKDPTRPGAAPGRHVGPMAQDLQKTSARDAVAKQPNGRLAVDTGRLSLRNTAAISQQQRDLDELKEMVAELGGAKKTPSGDVPMSWEQPGSGFRWDPSVATTVPRVPEGDLPERFRTYAAPPVRPGRTFTRAAVESALDAAALPVKAASRAADYFTGNDSAFSNISGKDAAESLEWLYDKSDPSSIRREEAFAEGEIPQTQKAGQLVGEYVGGAPLAALTGRVPTFGAVVHAAKKKPEVKPSTGFRSEAATQQGMSDTFGKPIPLDEAASLIGVYDKLGGDNPSLKVSAGPGSVTVKYHHDGAADQGFDTAIERTFTRSPEGLSVHHDLFTLPKDLQGKGVGKEILKNQVEKYDELGVKEITLEAAWQGRSVWPRMGFELQNPADLPPMKRQFAKYLRDRGVPFDQAEAIAEAPRGIHELALVKAPKPPRALSSQVAPNGTDFLNLWPKPIALKVDLQGTSGEQLRNYLGVSR